MKKIIKIAVFMLCMVFAVSDVGNVSAATSTKKLYMNYMEKLAGKGMTVGDYRIVDLNKDGQKELLLYYNAGGVRGSGRVCTIKNGKVKKLLDVGGQPTFYKISGSKVKFVVSGADSAFQYHYGIYTISGNSVEKLMTYTENYKNPNKAAYKKDGKKISQATFDKFYIKLKPYTTTTYRAAKTVVPNKKALIATAVSSNMPNGSYAVAFDPKNIEKRTDGDYLNMEFFNRDFYVASEIETLVAGDTIKMHNSKGKMESIAIKNIGIADNKVYINGGIEKGGKEMWKESNGFYCSVLMDATREYYSIGSMAIRLSKKCEYTTTDVDSKYVAEGKTVIGAAKGFKQYPVASYYENNTSIMIENNEITKISVIWRP